MKKPTSKTMRYLIGINTVLAFIILYNTSVKDYQQQNFIQNIEWHFDAELHDNYENDTLYISDLDFLTKIYRTKDGIFDSITNQSFKSISNWLYYIERHEYCLSCTNYYTIHVEPWYIHKQIKLK